MTQTILIFFGSFVVTILLLPGIIQVVQQKCLQDQPNYRAAHQVSTPTMGGIAIFAAIFINLLFWNNAEILQTSNYIVLGLFFIFLVGITDDLINLSPIKKLLGQSITAGLLIASGIKLTSLYGLMGIESLTPIMSYCCTFLFILLIINALNLIDGIDGLAGSIALVISLCLGVWFYVVGAMLYCGIAFALAGALLGFLKYNFAPASIFMGDAGSLVIGYLIAMLSIQFLEFNQIIIETMFSFENPLAILVSILFIPLFDTLRVFFVRLSNGYSPFRADKNHLHHLLLKAGFKHQKATLTLVSLNIFFIAFTYNFQFLNVSILIVLQFILAMIFTITLEKTIKNKTTKSANQKTVFTLYSSSKK